MYITSIKAKSATEKQEATAVTTSEGSEAFKTTGTKTVDVAVVVTVVVLAVGRHNKGSERLNNPELFITMLIL